MKVEDSDPNAYVVSFTRNEALVLEGLLARWDDSNDHTSVVLEDQAEQRLLWDLTGVVAEGRKCASGGAVFTDDWPDIIERARSALRDPQAAPGIPGLQ